MTADKLGKIYTLIMSLYFMVSGFNALFDIDAKLARVGLSAVDSDGKIAFILIYCSLMIGIGLAIGLIYYLSKNWIYPSILAITIVSCFVIFRFVGAMMVGELSETQLSFILFELLEVSIGVLLVTRSKKLLY